MSSNTGIEGRGAGLGQAALSRRSFVACAAMAVIGAVAAGAGIGGVRVPGALADEGQTITIEALGADETAVQVEVPYDPQRIAILDFAALDVIGSLGLAGRVVGSASTTIEYLDEYLADHEVAQLGTIKEADLEATMACEPDIIFIGGRLASMYDQLNEIAPVVLLTTDTTIGLVASVEKNATTIASIFGMEDQIAEKMAGFKEQIDAIREIGEGHTAVIGMCTSGSFNILGNGGRLSLIVNECGFTNVADGTEYVGGNSRGGSGSGHGGSGERGGSGRGGDGGSEASGEGQAAAEGSGAANTSSTNPHGQETSFEGLVSLDPDYVFVMDRDAAIGAEGAQQAREILDNDLVNGMRAAQDGHIVYLGHSAVWYTAEGGITALEVMLQDLDEGLGIEG